MSAANGERRRSAALSDPRAAATWSAHVWREGLALKASNGAIVFTSRSPAPDAPAAQHLALPVVLDDRDIANVSRAESLGACAATCFGPVGQEKLCNEDAALGAAFVGGADGPVAMICVADGVTTKTFWPERSSRIACLVAYACVRDHLADGKLNSPAEIELLKRQLQNALVTAFEADREAILAAKAAPPSWNRALFERHAGNDKYWYNTTLLLAVLSPKGGLALWAGDGGVVRTRRLRGGVADTVQALKSGPDSRVFNIAALGAPIAFQAVRIEAPPEMTDLRLALMSDGADRTTQINEIAPQHWTDLAGVERGAVLLRALTASTVLPNAERDNFSVATLDWRALNLPRSEMPRPPAPTPEPARAPRASARSKASASPVPPKPLTAAQKADLGALARAKIVEDKWLAAFVVARCRDDSAAAIAELTQIVLTAAPWRETLIKEIDTARRRPVASRRALGELVREIERVARLIEALSKD